MTSTLPAPEALASLFPLELVADLSLPAWRRVLAGVLRPEGSLRDIEDALLAPQRFSLAQEERLEALAVLGTFRGRRALRRAARVLDVELEAREEPPGEATPLARALSVLERAETSAEVARVVAWARTELAQVAPAKRTRLFVARRALDLAKRDVMARASTIERALADLLRERDVRLRIEVRTVLDSSNVAARFLVVRSRRDLNFGATQTDLVRLDLARGRLFLTSEKPRFVRALRRALGEALANDPSLFEERPTITLQPLAAGARSLHASALKASIVRVRVIRLRWDSGDDDTVELAGRDVLRAVERRGMSLEGGRIESATLRLELAGKAARADVRLEPPWGVDLPEGAIGAFVEQYLEAIGLLAPREDEPDDLFSLEPWTHPEARLRAALGDDYAPLAEAKAFSPVQVRAVAHPDLPEAGRALLAFPVDAAGASFYGISQHEDVPSRALAPHELVVQRFDVGVAAELCARALGLSSSRGAGSAVDLGAGLFDLGTRSFGAGASVRVLFATTARAQARASSVEASVGEAARIVVLVPVARAGSSATREVPLRSLAGRDPELLARVVQAAGLAEHVDAVLVAEPGARLVVDLLKRHRVWLDGVLIEGLTEMGERYVDLIASRGGRPVPRDEVQKHLSRNRKTDGVERKTKLLVKAAMRASFEGAGVKAPEDLDEVFLVDARGHRVGVSVFRRG